MYYICIKNFGFGNIELILIRLKINLVFWFIVVSNLSVVFVIFFFYREVFFFLYVKISNSYDICYLLNIYVFFVLWFFFFKVY